jgi:hypothetical protein
LGSDALTHAQAAALAVPANTLGLDVDESLPAAFFSRTGGIRSVFQLDSTLPSASAHIAIE